MTSSSKSSPNASLNNNKTRNIARGTSAAAVSSSLGRMDWSSRLWIHRSLHSRERCYALQASMPSELGLHENENVAVMRRLDRVRAWKSIHGWKLRRSGRRVVRVRVTKDCSRENSSTCWRGRPTAAVATTRRQEGRAVMDPIGVLYVRPLLFVPHALFVPPLESRD
jgi:hypothetical protein